jgi:tetraacyldisaccharide 4'-kinase
VSEVARPLWADMGRGYLERVILGEERGLLSWAVRGFAWPLSIVYRSGLCLYLWLYRVGLRKKCKLPATVISIGNLTFGGTGKTPAVEKVCRILTGLGLSVAILSRGYGSRTRGSLIVSDGNSIFASVDQCGDESLVLAQSLPGIPVVVGKDRRASGRLACEKFNSQVLVLDDGFQYWQLDRDLDIVIIDGSRPFGSGYIMPSGNLREPITGLRRAHAVLINSTSSAAAAVEDSKRKVQRIAPAASIFVCRRKPVRIRKVDGSIFDLSWLRGRRVVAFCGIGNPRSFFDTLVSIGAVLCESIAFPDHHVYSDAEIEQLLIRLGANRADALLTTAKDAVRLKNSQRIKDLYVLDIVLEIDEEHQFTELLKSVINKPC